MIDTYALKVAVEKLKQLDQVHVARMLTLRQMLKLEMVGMKRSRSPSAYEIIKRELGLEGDRSAVLAQATEAMKEAWPGVIRS